MFLTGRLIVVLLIGLVPFVFFPLPSTLIGWSVLVLLVFFVDVLLAMSPKQLVLSRPETGVVSRDESIDLMLNVHNPTKRVFRGVVRDAWQPSVETDTRDRAQTFVVEAGKSIDVTTRAQPSRRGRLVADHVAMRSVGPLGLGGRQRVLTAEGSVLVLPKFRSRKHLPGLLRRLRWIEGQVAVRLRGQGTEFDSLRDYVRGDDIRSIDWRGTARRQQLTVRTWRPEQDRRVLIVVDTSRTSAVRIDNEPRLDASLDASLLLSALAIEAEDRVDVVALDAEIRADVPGLGRSKRVRDLMVAMAPVAPTLFETHWPLVNETVLPGAGQYALIVLVTSVDATVATSGLLPLVEVCRRRSQVIVATAHDQELDEMAEGRGDADVLHLAAAAERERLHIHGLESELNRAGAKVVRGTAEQLPLQVCNVYLDMKLNGDL